LDGSLPRPPTESLYVHAASPTMMMKMLIMEDDDGSCYSWLNTWWKAREALYRMLSWSCWRDDFDEKEETKDDHDGWMRTRVSMMGNDEAHLVDAVVVVVVVAGGPFSDDFSRRRSTTHSFLNARDECNDQP
jgi:hypothetical protein